jgi:putative component of membrane protein insertase Oxa1/YidC/SpoIIIJ protein YidD
MLLLIIRLYRFFLKKRMNKTCLFKVSCSHFVENEYQTKGPLAGWCALWLRMNDCQAGYQFTKILGKPAIQVKSGRTYLKEELSEALVKELDHYFLKE